MHSTHAHARDLKIRVGLGIGLGLGLGLLASVVMVACSSPQPAAEGGEDVSEEELRAPCTYSRKYFVAYDDGAGSCKVIPAERGSWIPEPLFQDAPPEVSRSTCTYRWSGEKYSRADRAALTEGVGFRGQLVSACGLASEPAIGVIGPIPKFDVHVGPLAGSVGCDVCGIVKEDRLWVILPPGKVFRKQLLLDTTDGESRAFRIEPTEARALSIALPASPSGAAYVEGRVRIY